jgi:hypothetical protein
VHILAVARDFARNFARRVTHRMSNRLHACLSTSNDRQSRKDMRALAPQLNGGKFVRDTKDEKTS